MSNTAEFQEGDRVEVTATGHVLWIGEKSFEVDDFVYSLADLHAGKIRVAKL